jgi:hypothetical protein
MAVTVPYPNCRWGARSPIAKPDASGMGSFDTGGPAAIFAFFGRVFVDGFSAVVFGIAHLLALSSGRI